MNDMQKIKFKKLVAQNFICFGQEAVVIDFESCKNITMIKGRNFDTICDVEDNSSSNGSGKSSILDAFIYALFGKTVKNPKKIGAKDVINNIIGKKMIVEIYFDDYKVQRTRKPDGLKLWKSIDGKFDDVSELTRGEMRQTQSLIESILGFNYETMKSICVFTDNNSDSYLESTAQDRRSIIENLLGLEKYRKFHEKTKEFIKQNKQEIDVQNIEINKNTTVQSAHSNNISIYENNKNQWSNQIQNDINKYDLEISMHEKQMKDLIADNKELEIYNNSQNQIILKEKETNELKVKIKKHEEIEGKIQTKAKELLAEIQNKKDELAPLNNENNLIKNNIKSVEKIISKIDNLSDGIDCDYCFNKVSHSNCSNIRLSKVEELEGLNIQLQQNIKNSDEIKSSIQAKLTEYKGAEELYKRNSNELKNSKDLVEKVEKDISELRKIEKPEIAVLIDKVNNKIALLKSMIIEKKAEIKGKSPYCDLILKTKSIISEIKEKIDSFNNSADDLKNKIKLYDFWLEAFSEKGIRKFIIDQILPILNKTISEMLEILIEGKLTLVFDNEFNETITKFPDGIEMPYDLLSNGQKRRINLALSQAFAYVRQLNVGNYPSIMFLDEISINMDSQGNQAIYNLIRTISKEKQVFVTTHDQELQGLLTGFDSETIVVEMKDGFSKIAQK